MSTGRMSTPAPAASQLHARDTSGPSPPGGALAARPERARGGPRPRRSLVETLQERCEHRSWAADACVGPGAGRPLRCDVRARSGVLVVGLDEDPAMFAGPCRPKRSLSLRPCKAKERWLVRRAGLRPWWRARR